MHLSPASLYGLRLSLSQGATSPLLRKTMAERNTLTSAVFLATVGLSLSVFSLRQMQTSPATPRQRRFR